MAHGAAARDCPVEQCYSWAHLSLVSSTTRLEAIGAGGALCSYIHACLHAYMEWGLAVLEGLMDLIRHELRTELHLCLHVRLKLSPPLPAGSVLYCPYIA